MLQVKGMTLRSETGLVVATVVVDQGEVFLHIGGQSRLRLHAIEAKDLSLALGDAAVIIERNGRLAPAAREGD